MKTKKSSHTLVMMTILHWSHLPYIHPHPPPCFFPLSWGLCNSFSAEPANKQSRENQSNPHQNSKENAHPYDASWWVQWTYLHKQYLLFLMLHSKSHSAPSFLSVFWFVRMADSDINFLRNRDYVCGTWAWIWMHSTRIVPWMCICYMARVYVC